MNYEETIAYLYKQLPMYSRIGKAAYKSDLTNTIRLCSLLNHPEHGFRSIHIAGTNGKGSTSHMLAAMLQQNGYKTGLYTSPHLKDFRERIRINGEMIPETRVVDFVEKYQPAIALIGCSFFEWTVGLAFDYFRQEAVDIAIIETGLGGRLDSTNLITPLLSIITNVSYDHTDLLGDSLKKIAIEKAGIIKPFVPVVIGESNPETADIFRQTAVENNAPITFADEQWQLISMKVIESFNEFELCQKDTPSIRIQLDLLGQYQELNMLTIMEARRQLLLLGLRLDETKCLEALQKVRLLTGLRGRWDILSTVPKIIADVAHNEAGLSYSIRQLTKDSQGRLHFVLGFVQDKDIQSILRLFPENATYYFCRPDIPRGLNAETLQMSAAEHGLFGKSYDSVSLAYEAAKKNAVAPDTIYVGGSTFVVAEIV